jgi:hypothetical protein
MLAYLKQNPSVNELLSIEMQQYLSKNEKPDFIGLMGALRPSISKLTYEENPMCGLPKLKKNGGPKNKKDTNNKVPLFSKNEKSIVAPVEKSLLEEFFELSELPNIKKRKRIGERGKDLKKRAPRKKSACNPESIDETIENVCNQVYR